MPTFEDAIGDMVDDLHAEAGRIVSYRRDGVSLGTATMSRHRHPSRSFDDGEGGVIEVLPYDFIAKTADLEALNADPPLTGDRIVVGTETYEVLPLVAEKTFRRVGDQMIRIFTKQISAS